MIRTAASCIALCAYLVSGAGSAWSETAEATRAAGETQLKAGTKPLSERWIPSLSGALVAFDYSPEGVIESGVRFSDSAKPAKPVPRIQLGFELMSPSLRLIPTGPRVVGFAGGQIGPKQEIQVAGVLRNLDRPFDPDEMERILGNVSYTGPRDLGNGTTVPGSWPPNSRFYGQGSQMFSTYLNWGWYMGVGLVFELPKRDGRDPFFRLRPYISYVGERAKFSGGVAEVTGQRIPVNPYLEPPYIDPSTGFPYPEGYPPYTGEYTAYRSEVASETEIFHYLGPGIEAEVILASGKNTTVSFFGQVSVLWNVGRGTLMLSDSSNGADFTYKYTADELSVRPAGGLRISWRGGL